MLAAEVTFQPVTTVAEVSTSNGKQYRVESCFTDPRHLRTRFIYPDRRETYDLRDGSIQIAETGKPDSSGGDPERRVAFGHNFHALALNAGRWGTAGILPLPFGGTMTVLARADGIPSEISFSNPDTTPYSLKFSDWRGDTPYRLDLIHAGVTYRYRFTKVEFVGC